MGIELGCGNADIRRYIGTNSLHGYLTSEGTLLMLEEWRNRTGHHEQQERLRSAMITAGLLFIADQFWRTGHGKF